MQESVLALLGISATNETSRATVYRVEVCGTCAFNIEMPATGPACSLTRGLDVKLSLDAPAGFTVLSAVGAVLFA